MTASIWSAGLYMQEEISLIYDLISGLSFVLWETKRMSCVLRKSHQCRFWKTSISWSIFIPMPRVGLSWFTAFLKAKELRKHWHSTTKAAETVIWAKWRTIYPRCSVDPSTSEQGRQRNIHKHRLQNRWGSSHKTQNWKTRASQKVWLLVHGSIL